MAQVKSKPVNYLAYKLGKDSDIPDWVNDLVGDDVVRFYYQDDELTNLLFADVDILYGDAYCGDMRGTIRLEGRVRWNIGEWLLSGDDGKLIVCSDDDLEENYEVIEGE